MKLTKQDHQQIEQANQALKAQQEARDKRIAMRSFLAQTQPVAFQLLDRSLKEDRLAHCYLFQGALNSLKEKMALLLAQSILIDPTKGLIDETQLSQDQQAYAIRIVEHHTQNFIEIEQEGAKMLSKDDVDAVQAQFARTSSEGNGNRVWIMHACENATIAAQNSILKFLEEPNSGVYAILTTEHLEQVLPTVRSRCVIVPFVSIAQANYEQEGKALGLDSEDVFFLSRLGHPYQEMNERVGGQAYQTAKAMFKQWFGLNGYRVMLACDYDVRYRIKAKGSLTSSQAKAMNMDLLQDFFTMLMMFATDCLRPQSDEDCPAWYHEAVQQFGSQPNAVQEAVRLFHIALEEKDLVNSTNDLNLLFDKAFYRLEVLHE